jgi:AbrB family looped-hinge helix DNA binding protein
MRQPREMEKRIRISTQGRLTIPKKIRDALNISDGQPILVRSSKDTKQIVIEILPTINEFSKTSSS